jgi:hypothetical protein
MLLPIAMPTVRSTLFFLPIAIAEPLSAAPPTMAEEHDADEHFRHAERLAGAFGGADQDLAHPRREHRRSDEAADRAPDAPRRAFMTVRLVPPRRS